VLCVNINLLVSLFTTAAVTPDVPDLSLIASLNDVKSLTSEILVVVIAAEDEPLPIVKPILPVSKRMKSPF